MLVAKRDFDEYEYGKNVESDEEDDASTQYGVGSVMENGC